MLEESSEVLKQYENQRHLERMARKVAAQKGKGYKKFSRRSKGPRNHHWKGEEAKIPSKHAWIKKYVLKPKNCECCGQEKNLDLANISQKYLRDLSDWEWICRKCHMIKDGRTERLKRVSINAGIAYRAFLKAEFDRNAIKTIYPSQRVSVIRTRKVKGEV